MSDQVSQSEIRKVYEESYIPYTIRWGRFTNLLGCVLSLAPAMVLLLVYGLRPPVSAVLAGVLAQVSVSGVFYFVEPISYFPIFGIPGTYMAFLSGNIANMRLPISAVAQEAAGVEHGSEKGAVISTLGIAVSIVVNIALLTISVFLGAAVLSMLPPAVTRALGFILPALFGAVFGQFAVGNYRVAGVAIAIAGFMTFLLKKGVFSFLGKSPSFVVIIVSVFGTIFFATRMHKTDQARKGTDSE